MYFNDYSHLVPYIIFPDPYIKVFNRGCKCTHTQKICRNYDAITFKSVVNNIFKLSISHWVLHLYVGKAVDAHFIIHFLAYSGCSGNAEQQ